MAKNYNIKGVTQYTGTSDEDKTVVSLLLTEERAEELIEKLELDPNKYESIPVKTTDNGQLVFRASSKYQVKIYDNGVETEDIKLEDIGKDSEVTIFVGISEATFKRKTFQVAYLKSINVIDLVDRVDFNPFDSDDVTEL